ncbi:hypothetical protein EVAR_52435_1 [Eumeta japonica]|uniref:RNA-directed DNA polymerase from mobile element jockey n=1 Tax=Eumeta variegata TaxID=151549 RepID=A0A4C1YNL4_EUMVA|nr:hypothetical protein EVAR_52435_1 [Eumeta japonica]
MPFYADDRVRRRAYFASARRANLAAKKIQQVFDLLLEWLDRWRMAVNVGKTAALLTGRQRNMPIQLRPRGQDMEWMSCIQYLGVHIDRSLRMIPQVVYVIQQSRAARVKLRPVLTSRLPTRTKITIYNCYIHSRLCCTGLVCTVLGAAALETPSPTEYCATNDRSTIQTPPRFNLFPLKRRQSANCGKRFKVDRGHLLT